MRTSVQVRVIYYTARQDKPEAFTLTHALSRRAVIGSRDVASRERSRKNIFQRRAIRVSAAATIMTGDFDEKE